MTTAAYNMMPINCQIKKIYTDPKMALMPTDWNSLYIPNIIDGLTVSPANRKWTLANISNMDFEKRSSFQKEDLKEFIEDKLCLGRVRRIDFVEKVVHSSVGDKIETSAFVYFDWWCYNTFALQLRKSLDSCGVYRRHSYYVSSKGTNDHSQCFGFHTLNPPMQRFLMFMINRNPTPDADTKLNIHQLAAAKTFLEKHNKDLQQNVEDADRQANDAEKRVKELEAKLHDIELRTKIVQFRESEVEKDKQKLEDEFDKKGDELYKQQKALYKESDELYEQQKALYKESDELYVREEALDARHIALNRRHISLNSRDIALDARHIALDARDTELDRRDIALDARDTELDRRDTELDRRHIALNSRDIALDARDTELDRRDTELDRRDTSLDARETALDAREDNFAESINPSFLEEESAFKTAAAKLGPQFVYDTLYAM